MIDLKKINLPSTVEVAGRLYPIRTDYRYFLRFNEHLKEKDATLDAFDYMYEYEIPESRLEGIRALCEFMNPAQTLPRRTGRETNEPVIDYELDADYIYAAFYEQYGIDLQTAALHWYKFSALLKGLHDTELNNIISARLWRPTGKNSEYEKHRQRQYEAWRLPDPTDNEPDEALEEFLQELK